MKHAFTLASKYKKEKLLLLLFFFLLIKLTVSLCLSLFDRMQWLALSLSASMYVFVR